MNRAAAGVVALILAILAFGLGQAAWPGTAPGTRTFAPEDGPYLCGWWQNSSPEYLGEWNFHGYSPVDGHFVTGSPGRP